MPVRAGSLVNGIPQVPRAGSSAGLERATHNRQVVGSNPTRPIPPPRAVGDQSELDAFARLHRAGYTELICPFRAARYDCVLDTGTELARVQIKTGRAAAGAVRCCTCSRNPCQTREDNAYHGDADCFAV